MKTGAILAAALSVICFSFFALGANVGPAGYTNDFTSLPAAADWATLEIPGGAGDTYDMDADVNANISAAAFTQQLPSSTGTPPGATSTAVWSSNGRYLQTRPTQVRYITLMGKFWNNTITNAIQVRLSYAFTIAEGAVTEESGMGNKVYYSVSGEPGSWINLPALNTTSSTAGRTLVSTNISVTWTNGGSLYVLWVDDNSNTGGAADPANQIDDFSLEIIAGLPPTLACTLIVPTNNTAFASGDSVIARANPVGGYPPYRVEFFTNSGVGNTQFASAGAVFEPPFQMNIGVFATGNYNIYAVATDDGDVLVPTASPTNTFVVLDGLSVTLDAPADGATLDHESPLVGRASVGGGTAPYALRFYLDGIANGPVVTTQPYERNFGTLFVGDHTVRATVTDARGWVSNSPVHTVRITGPLAAILGPTNGSVFTFGQRVILDATVGGGAPPYTATFYTNGFAAGVVSAPPFTLDLGVLPIGAYTSYVHVIDSDSPTATDVVSTTNVFSVLPSALFVFLSNPQDGLAVLEGRVSTFSGSAGVSAPATIVRVEFYYDDVLAGVDTTSPYSVTFTNNVDGTHRVYMVAVDSLGRRAYSVTNRLTVVDNTVAPNDNFNNAIAFTGPAAFANSHNNGATKQAGEPNHAANNSGGGSLWWTWTPSTSGPATIDTIGSDFDTLLGVYTGNAVNQLTIIAQNDDSSGLQSRVQFNATAGTLYRIAVDGYSGSRGLIRLNIRGAGGVEMQTPTNGTITVVGDPITVTARILPDFPNPPVSRVEFYRAGVLFASVTNEPFTVITTNSPAGSNTFYVVAIDSVGTRLQTASATVFVQAIGVMILTPLANTTFSSTNPITINAWTYLPEGTITNVDFFVDAVKIGSDATPPFSIVWTNVTSGSHRLTAVGSSDRGTSHASAAVNIGVMFPFVPNNAVWRYLDDGSNQGTNWRRLDFDDSAWPSGPAPLGFGDSGGRLPATLNAAGRITYYYRYTFVVTNPSSISFVNSSIERDDGAVAYLNGNQVYFDFNMPSSVSYTTPASSSASDDGTASWGFGLATSQLRQGTNVVAVEVHQISAGDSDLWFRLTMNAAPIIVQNVPPLVSITNPTNNQYFLAPSNILVEANASDLEGPVRRVEFFANGVRIGEVTNAPWGLQWDSPAVGDYVLTARATDNQNATTTSAPVPIVVYDAAGTPFARVAAPANGAVMEGPTNLLVTAIARAIAGVTNVQFVANGEVFGEDASQPYSAIWTAPFGTNVLTAVAFDANGITGTSAAVTVTITIPPTNVIAPTITTQLPIAGSTITNLTNITVRFSEYVQNIDASDLLINGLPATSVDASHSRSNYTFAFPQPSYGEVRITWAAGHGITDYGWPTVLPFDETSPAASWTYNLLDQTPPSIAARNPAPGSTVSNVSHISVTFTENVSGVDAADLRLNGTPALDVNGTGSNYIFSVPQQPPGTISVTWNPNHNIVDLAAIPNAFNHAAAGATWSFVLDTRAVLVQSNSFWRFIRGTNEPSIPIQAWRQLAFDDSSWTFSPAPFFYGDPYDTPQIPGTVLNDMANNSYSTIYLRTKFTVVNRSLITNVWLNAQSDDGFKLWLNGVEIHRYNAPAGDVPYNTYANSASPEPNGQGAAYILTTLSNAVANLVDGENIVAVQAFNQGPVSSDFGFNAQLYTYLPDASAAPPYVLTSNPPEGDVSTFANLTITFSEPIRGVDAADLLVNGVPATAMSSTTNMVYTFTFPQPPFGPVMITWDPNHGISDFDDPARPFDGNSPNSILNYYIINPSSPRILTQAPLGGSTITGLTTIVVTFNEPITGLDAADLLINGAPASSMTALDQTNYAFAVAQPPFGFVTVRWADNHGIVDLEAANPFDGVRFGAQWNYILIDPAPTATLTSPTNGAYRLAPAAVSLAATANDYDGTVERIAFYANGLLVGVSTNTPFVVDWSNVPFGIYLLTAVAIDDSGLMGTSAPVVLNVVTSLPAALVRGPYLQMGTPVSGIVRWRTDLPADALVYYGTDPLTLTNIAVEAAVTNEHIVQLTGLRPSTTYYYSIGSAALRLAGTNGVDSQFWFKTSPPNGSALPTRLWVLGDPGTAGIGSADRQNRTRDAFYAFAANSRPADLWLMLGDNAYNRGEDDEYQRAVFDIYPDTLRNVFLWPTLGNHETAQSFTATDFPYLHIFSLPQNGEAGGVPSGTEKYYSFDYANIHFVCLDSMTSGQTADSPMAEWLRADLASATATWIIAFFHHPPYTRGNHNSDFERELIDIRANLIPILEENGVDLVLNGHSHAWERSYLLHGHYGLSSTLDESMKVDPGDGREDGTGVYRKNQEGHGVVYTVAGNAGQVTGGSLDHPAHYVSFNDLGTMVIDIQGNRLDAIFLREDGQIPDHFTILKPEPRPDAPLHLLAQPSGPAEVSLSWTDASTNELAFIIERSLDGTNFAEHLVASANAVTALDTGLVNNVTYFYRVRGTNSVGLSDYSNIASITVINASALPLPPANLLAAAGDDSGYFRSRIVLHWTDASDNEAGFVVERSRDGVVFVPLTTVAANSTVHTDTGLQSSTFYFYRVRAINILGQSSATSIASTQTHPQSHDVAWEDTVALYAGIEGAPSARYQWRLNNTPIPGETNDTLVIPAADLQHHGEYTVVIVDGGRSETAGPAMLFVRVPPRIIRQPQDIVRAPGMTATFDVLAEGSPPLTYRWRRGTQVIGDNSPMLTLSNVQLSDQTGYDVVIENTYGTNISRVATLTISGAPSLVQLPDLFAEVLRPMFVTNVTIDPNIPPLDLRFTLAPDAPSNARVNPRTGVFYWTPTRAHAPGTNNITISVFDHVNTALSNAMTFTVRVNDYVEVIAGSLVISAGTNGAVPLRVVSSIPLTQFQCNVGFTGNYFSNFSAETFSAQLASVTAEPLNAPAVRITVTPTAGNTLLGTNDVALLRFTLRPQTNSALVPLRVSAIAATAAASASAPTLVATDGKLIVVGSAPFLDAHFTSAGQRELTVYGQPANYTLQFSTNLTDPLGWRMRAFVRVSNNLERAVNVAGTPTNVPVFFRVRLP